MERTAAEISQEISEKCAAGASPYDREIRELIRDYQQADRLGL